MAGFIVWALQFTAIYGGHVVFCLGAAGLADAFIIAATVVAAAVLAAFLGWQDRAARLLGVDVDNSDGADWRAGCDRIARVVAVLALVAVVWSGATVFFVESCFPAR